MNLVEPRRGGRPSTAAYRNLTDREVVALAQGGDTGAVEHLLCKYRNLVKAKVKSYFLAGAEKDDLLQVGMIGLWRAVVDFRCDRAVSFPAFAKVCVQRHVITAIKTVTRQKQEFLNHALSLDTSDDPAGDWNLSDTLTGGASLDPAEVLLRREDAERLRSALRGALSEFEWRVLAGYDGGDSYRDIAADLGCTPKSVDNALGRIKRKVASLSPGEAEFAIL